MDIQLSLVELRNTEDYNIVVGMSHFIKTVEDIHELMVTAVPNAKFGLAFCEASGPRKIRKTGTDKLLVKEAVRMASEIRVGHSFILVMKDMYPINILPGLKQIAEIVQLFCASANPVQVIVAESKQGRGILGVIDGGTPTGVETLDQEKERKVLLRTIGYKLE